MDEQAGHTAEFPGRPAAAPQAPRLPIQVKAAVTELALDLVAHVLAEAARRLVENRDRRMP